MATAHAFRIVNNDYTALLPHLDGASNVVAEPGTSLSEPAGFFATPNWCDAGFLVWCGPNSRKLVILEYDDSTDVISTTNKGPGGTSYDHGLGDYRTDDIVVLSLSAADVIDEFTKSEAAATLSGRTAGVSAVFAAHGLTRVDPPGTTGR